MVYGRTNDPCKLFKDQTIKYKILPISPFPNNLLFSRRKLSKQVGNTVGKGEIARYEQFLLFPQCFQKVYFPGVSKGVIVWEWVKICWKNGKYW